MPFISEAGLLDEGFSDFLLLPPDTALLFMILSLHLSLGTLFGVLPLLAPLLPLALELGPLFPAAPLAPPALEFDTRILLRSLEGTFKELPVESLVMVTDPRLFPEEGPDPVGPDDPDDDPVLDMDDEVVDPLVFDPADPEEPMEETEDAVKELKCREKATHRGARCWLRSNAYQAGDRRGKLDDLW